MRTHKYRIFGEAQAKAKKKKCSLLCATKVFVLINNVLYN